MTEQKVGEHRFNKFFSILAFAALLSASFTASAETENCISQKDMVEIGASFSQIRSRIKDQAEYCKSDLGKQIYDIVKSLVVLKNIQPNEPEFNSDDAFTHKAINENNWWAYFTKRATEFSIQETCREGVIAYVIPAWARGRIHLCPRFFEQSVSDQASTMMHEVRHFDGFRHTRCNRGNEEGLDGACDNNISQRGSYAISVQTLVGLARAKETDEAEKPLLEAQALYMAFNKFNEVPKVKLTNSIYLSSDNGEVYKWTPTEDRSFDLVGNLKEPALIKNSFNNLTIYPINITSDAYRKDQTLETKVENPGLFAKHYNSEVPSERAKYKSVSYFGAGGLLKDNTLITLCNNKDLSERNLDQLGDFERIISLSLDDLDIDRLPVLLEKSGKLISYECVGQNSTEVSFSETGLTFDSEAKNVVQSFGLGGSQLAIMKDGSLKALNLASNSRVGVQDIEMPVENRGWVSAAPFSKPEVF